MVYISDVYDVLNLFYSKQNLLWSAASISKFHRIQGSSELEKAVDYVAKELIDLKNFEINIRKFNYGENYGLHYNIVGWDVENGSAVMVKPGRKILSTFLKSKTTVAAHSPSGDVEAEVVYVGNGLDIEKYGDVANKIVLSYGSPYLVYKLGCKHGAAGFMFFKKDVYDSAIPYIGLFLSREDAAECRAPAVAVSRVDAYRIIDRLLKGDKVVARVYVESRFRAEASIPILELSIGDGDSEIHLYGHVCHPAGTINDNVSGVVSLIELATAIDQALNKNMIRYARYKKLVFVIFPEYYGSLPYLLEKIKSSNIEFSVNLDMIGEKQHITNSTLYFIKSLNNITNKLYEGIVLKALFYGLSKTSTFSETLKTISYRFDITPYDSGSDHDIYLQFYIPSIMINQWPDLYYHSDMDTLDKFDPDIASSIATSIGAAVYLISSEQISEKTRDKIEKTYVKIIESFIEMKKEENSLKSLENMETIDVQNTKLYRYSAPRGIITTKFLLNKLDFENTLNLMAELGDRFTRHLFSRYIPLILSIKSMTITEIIKQIEYEYNRVVHLQQVEKIINYLHKIGLIEIM